MHYANRSCIYPLKIKGGKPTPLIIFLLAMSFCMWNGYMQVKDYDKLIFSLCNINFLGTVYERLSSFFMCRSIIHAGISLLQ